MSKLTKKQIVRAWTDKEYRNSLTIEELSELPENPAGAVELSDKEMSSSIGGFGRGGATFASPSTTNTFMCSWGPHVCSAMGVCGSKSSKSSRFVARRIGR